jgi:3'(2'), 5'-bisphosphate nucleotidase
MQPEGDPVTAGSRWSADAVLARRLAAAAGALLEDLRRCWGEDARSLRDAGDRRSHELLAGELSRCRPDDAVLSEEAADDPRRLSAERVWIVDPLDGTREYGEPGRVDWAVHVALWSAGRLVAGAVALPALGVVHATDAAPALPPYVDRAPRLVASRTRPPAVVHQLAGRLSGELLPMGSAGAKAMAVVRGEAEVYVHAGGPYEWDSAAPVAVATAAGLHCSRVDGSPLRYNQPDPSLPDLLVCRRELAVRVLDALAR